MDSSTVIDALPITRKTPMKTPPRSTGAPQRNGISAIPNSTEKSTVLKTVDIPCTLKKETYQLIWTVNGFNLMPFIREHPLFGPSIRLGKEIDSTWQLLLSKQRGEEDKLPSLGFKLVKTEDNTIWDVCRYDITVRSVDGKTSLEVVKNALAGGEEDLPYIYVKGALESVYKNEEGQEQREDDTPVKKKKPSMNSQRYEKRQEKLALLYGELRSFLGSTERSKRLEDAWNVILDEMKPIIDSTEGAEKLHRDVEENESYSKELCEKIDPVLQSLFKEESIVVTCDIRYTYMTNNPDEPSEDNQERLLVHDLKQLYKSHKFSDVIVRVGKREFYSHKNILCSRSFKFDVKLQEDRKVPLEILDLEDVTESVAEKMLLFMYTGELMETISSTDCYGLYMAGMMHGVNYLRNASYNILIERARQQPLCDPCVTDDEKFRKLVELEELEELSRRKLDMQEIDESPIKTKTVLSPESKLKEV